MQKRDKLLKRMYAALLAIFDFISPALIFLCIKARNPDAVNGKDNIIR